MMNNSLINANDVKNGSDDIDPKRVDPMNENNPAPIPQPQPPGSPAYIHYVGMPVGSVIAFAGEIRNNDSGPNQTNLPMFNWLLCDGKSVKKIDYPELFSALGGRYGESGDSFNVPNYQGTFLRGVDLKSTQPGSTENRHPPNSGSKNSVGSTQNHALESHEHYYEKPTSGITVPSESSVGVVASQIRVKTTGPAEENCKVSKNETRPVNTFVYWLIKTRLD